jgi:hypothetical protein
MRRALTSIVLALACSCNEAPSHTTAATGSTSTKQPEGPPAPPKNTFAAPGTNELAALTTALAGHLAAAREAKDPIVRSAALERAADIDPFDAATLAELGRAYIESDRLVEAARSFELAVRHADEGPLRAALLTELGAVLEGLGERSRAAELHQRSVALHPTELATARLAGLTGGVEVISHDTCVWTRHGAVPVDLCPAYVQARDAPPSTCAYVHPPLVLDADTKVAIFSHLDPSTAIEVYVVNAIIGGVWYSSPLTWVSHPEVEHADESVARLDMRLEQLAPDRKPQVVIEWELERRAVDLGNQEIETRTSTHLAVLAVSSADPRWWLGVRTGSSLSEQPMGESAEPKRTQTSVSLSWMPKTGEFELLRTEHSPSATLGKFALGTYPLLCPSEIDGS